MGAEIIKVCKEHLPSLRFIGKCYTNADRGPDGGYGHKWREWFQKGWFQQLEQLGVLQGIENGYLGLMGCSDKANSFQYWIGVFFPEQTAVPEHFDSVDIPEGDVGICWIYGNSNNGELYGQEPHNRCMAKLQENQMSHFRDDCKGPEEKWWWFFERYNHPRFTTPDDQGNVILDYGMYLAK